VRTSPTWPDNTKGISTLRLTLKLRPTELLSGLRGAVEEHINIVDYPGEWLLDLGLMDKSYEEWSKDVLHRMANRSFGADYVNALTDLDPSDPFTDAAAKSLATHFTDYLEIERAARQVATVTAMVPIPWIDVLAAFGTNLRMIRRIGEIYGGALGPLVHGACCGPSRHI
jgi:predicted YcjX-like family ATPase